MDWIKEAESLRSVLIQDTLELIRIPSVASAPLAGAPFGAALAEALSFMQAKAEADGFTTRNYDQYVMTAQAGNRGHRIGVLCHLDVVPAQKEGWTDPPFAGTVRNNILYGRGSNDNKGPTIAVYHAARLVMRFQEQWKNQLTLVFGCDEEGFMSDMDYYKAHEPLVPELGFVPDCTFPLNYGEHGLFTLQLSAPAPEFIRSISAGDHVHILAGQAEVTVTHTPPGFEDYFHFFLEERQLTGSVTHDQDCDRITLTGKAAHGSRPAEGICAPAALFAFLGAAYHDETCLRISQALGNWQGRGLDIAYKNMQTGELSLCFSMLDQREGQLHCVCDLRYPVSMDPRRLTSQIRTQWLALFPEGSMSLLEDRPGHYLNPDTPFVRKLEDIYRKVSGDKISPAKVSPGDTYARKLEHFISYGPTTPDHLRRREIGQAHQVNEGMDIDTLIQGTAIYAEALWTLLTEESFEFPPERLPIFFPETQK